MGRHREVNYEQVAQLAAQLQAKGISPTNVAIKTELGGSYSTIAPFLKQWRALNTAPTPSEVVSLPDGLARAFQAEVARQVKEATAALQAQLDDTTAALDGVTKEQAEAAVNMGKTERLLDEARATIQNKQGGIEALALRLQDMEDKHKAEIKELQQKITDEQIRAAQLQVRMETCLERLHAEQQENTFLQDRHDTLASQVRDMQENARSHERTQAENAELKSVIATLQGQIKS